MLAGQADHGSSFDLNHTCLQCDLFQPSLLFLLDFAAGMSKRGPNAEKATAGFVICYIMTDKMQ